MTEPPNVADPTKAVAGYLKTMMGDAVEDRVWRPELDQDFINEGKMPAAALVVMPEAGGGMMAGNRLPVRDSCVAVLAYGATRLEGDELARLAQHYLRQFNQVLSEGVLMYWCREASGITPHQEQQVNWPFALAIYQVLFAEVLVT
jgi:hypothetical protein